MPLLFAGETLSNPSGVCPRFRMTDIYRTIQPKRELFEHSSPPPAVLVSLPKHGVRNSILRFPFPIRSPQGPLFITSGFDKFQELPIAYLVPVDREWRNSKFQALKFIVPAKSTVRS